MKAVQEIRLRFLNHGLRSYIEVDLCRECPRQDDKGCCGHYSPVFYSTDLAYLALHRPDLVDLIFSQPHLTILDASVTVNNAIDGDSYRCRFHQLEGGCVLEQENRESVCRHFVCPGIGWQQEEDLRPWRQFFELLEDYEISLNQRIAERLQSQGLTLRDPDTRPEYFEVLKKIYLEETQTLPEEILTQAAEEERCLLRTLSYGEDWELFYKLR
jgi:hypothetical protein